GAHLRRPRGRARTRPVPAARRRRAAAARLRSGALGLATGPARAAVLRGGRSHPHPAGGGGAGVITASFRHIAGIGPLRERQLWFAGIRSWSELPASGDVLSPRLDGKLREGVTLSLRKLSEGDVAFFARPL